MIVYRIGDCRYINDLSGKGAALYGARWNSKDVYMLYTAQSAALALLEAVVHLGGMPTKGFCMATIELPEIVAPAPSVEALPQNWYSNPAPDFLKEIGDSFIRSNKYLALPVPSAVMSDEHNYLVNPIHPHFAKVRIINVKPLRLDDRIFKPVSQT